MSVSFPPGTPHSGQAYRPVRFAARNTQTPVQPPTVPAPGVPPHDRIGQWVQHLTWVLSGRPARQASLEHLMACIGEIPDLMGKSGLERLNDSAAVAHQKNVASAQQLRDRVESGEMDPFTAGLAMGQAFQHPRQWEPWSRQYRKIEAALQEYAGRLADTRELFRVAEGGSRTKARARMLQLASTPCLRPVIEAVATLSAMPPGYQLRLGNPSEGPKLVMPHDYHATSLQKSVLLCLVRQAGTLCEFSPEGAEPALKTLTELLRSDLTHPEHKRLALEILREEHEFKVIGLLASVLEEVAQSHRPEPPDLPDDSPVHRGMAAAIRSEALTLLALLPDDIPRA